MWGRYLSSSLAAAAAVEKAALSQGCGLLRKCSNSNRVKGVSWF